MICEASKGPWMSLRGSSYSQHLGRGALLAAEAPRFLLNPGAGPLEGVNNVRGCKKGAGAAACKQYLCRDERGLSFLGRRDWDHAAAGEMGLMALLSSAICGGCIGRARPQNATGRGRGHIQDGHEQQQQLPLLGCHRLSCACRTQENNPCCCRSGM